VTTLLLATTTSSLVDGSSSRGSGTATPLRIHSWRRSEGEENVTLLEESLGNYIVTDGDEGTKDKAEGRAPEAESEPNDT